MQPIPLSKPMTPELARAVYACLVAGCDAPVNEMTIAAFIEYITMRGYREWCFGGSLGCGGKLYIQSNSLWVGCYGEDENPDRLSAITCTMRALAVLMESK